MVTENHVILDRAEDRAEDQAEDQANDPAAKDAKNHVKNGVVITVEKIVASDVTMVAQHHLSFKSV